MPIKAANVIRKLLFVLWALFLFSAFEVPTEAQQAAGNSLDQMRGNAKLHLPDAVLADFMDGNSVTGIIVTIKPAAAARDLTEKSRAAAAVPSEPASPDVPAHYDLGNLSIRSRLKTVVDEHVDRAIRQLDPQGLTITQRFSYQFGFAARVTPVALQRILDMPEVILVEKDVMLKAHLAQGIPLMNGTATRSTYTGAGLSIAICDTGIDTSHPMLGGGGSPFNAKVIGGYDTGDGDADPRPNSGSGEPHGTSCAGIAAGSLGSVSDYIGGVAPDAKLYAIKISTGDTGNATGSAMIAGWEWCVTHQNDDPANPIMVISTSFGGGQYSSTCDSASPSMTTAAANAVAAGITLFASSGNDGYCDSMGWPACISHVNSVGAVYDASFGTAYPCVSSTSCASKTASTSCTTGYYATDVTSADLVTSFSNSASFLTLFAPSNSAYTTDIVGTGGYSSGDYVNGFGGTSAACPYAAGAAAVLQQAALLNTGAYLTPAEVRSYLVNNGDNITDGKAPSITKPRVNIGNAIAALPASGAPLATTSAATSVTATGATLNGTVTAKNASTAVTFEYGTTTGYGNTVTADQSPVTGNSPTPVSKALTGLSPATEYHFRVKALSTGGTTYGNDMTFTTASSVCPTIADGSFEGGSPNASWAETSSNFGTPLCTIAGCGAGGGIGPRTGSWWSWFGGVSGAVETGSLSQVVTITAGSTPRLLFYLNIPAYSGNGTDFLSVLMDGTALFTVLEGDPAFTGSYALVGLDLASFADGGVHTLSFESTTTGSPTHTNFMLDDVAISCSSSSLPDIQTGAAGSISQTAATLNGTVNPHGSSTTAAFEYGTTVAYGSTATATQSPLSGGSAAAVSAPISGLAAGTTYHYRLRGQSTAGIVYGNDQTFSTLCGPTVAVGATQYASIQLASSAAGNDDVIKLTSSVFTEDPIFSGSGTVTLRGGYTCDMLSNPGVSTVVGIITFEGNRTVVIDKIVVQ